VSTQFACTDGDGEGEGMYLRLGEGGGKIDLPLVMVAIGMVVLSCAGDGAGHRKNVLRKDTEKKGGQLKELLAL
jgi:hypothetical protein